MKLVDLLPGVFSLGGHGSLPHTVNYRRLLLQAVDLFLEQTPDARSRAHRLVQRCSRSEVNIPFSLNSWVWGEVISSLSDVVYYDNIPYLYNIRDVLAGKSLTKHRSYVNYDFREEMTSDEQLWLEKAQELLSFLVEYPFAATPDEARKDVQTAVAIQTYKQMAADLRQFIDRMDATVPWGTETIYHLVLREVTEIVTNVHLDLSLTHFGYWVPLPPYGALHEESHYPNIAETLVWAQKALDAIRGKAWLFITHQITLDHVHFSFH